MQVKTFKQQIKDNRRIKIVAPVSNLAKLVYKTIVTLAENNLSYDKNGVRSYLISANRFNKEELEEIDNILNSI
jgi:hypothetical protein